MPRLERPSALDAPSSCGRVVLHLAHDVFVFAVCDQGAARRSPEPEKCFAAGTMAAVRGDGPQRPAVLSILESAMVMHVIIQLLTTPASTTGVVAVALKPARHWGSAAVGLCNDGATHMAMPRILGYGLAPAQHPQLARLAAVALKPARL